MVNLSVTLVGIVVLRCIRRLHHAAHRLDTERQRNHVEQEHVALRSHQHAEACTAAPRATTWSGLIEHRGSRWNISATGARTSGIRVEPPTSTTASIAAGVELGVGERHSASLERARENGAAICSRARA